MNLEQAVQKRFINAITKQEELEMPSGALQVYQDLVYYRFLEVFEKAYPCFKKMVSEEKFSELIYRFLKVGAKDPILWRVSGEFKEFLIKENDLELEFLADLLEFEFLEVEMYMHKYTEYKQDEFSLESQYILSEDVNLRIFSFAVHHPDFDDNPQIFERGEYTVLFYYDEATQSIIQEEITPFVASFLQTITIERSILSFIKEIAKEYEVTSEELLEILLPILKNYTVKNIIVTTQTLHTKEVQYN